MGRKANPHEKYLSRPNPSCPVSIPCDLVFYGMPYAFSLTCRAILFDLDGVLIDSNDLYEAHWRSWAAARDVSFEHIRRVHHGRPIPETIQLVAPHLDPVQEAQVYIDTLLKGGHWHRVTPYAKVAALLDALPNNSWAIVTSAPRAVVVRHLVRLRLPLPGVLVAGDDAIRGKPSPDPWRHAARGLGVPISRCVAIEDAPAGVTSAHRAGARVIALTTTNSVDRLSDADYIAAELGALSVTQESDFLRIDYPASSARAASTASSV